MAAIAKTRLLADTSKNGVNRNASTITKDRIVGVGTPTASECAFDGLNVSGVTLALGALQEDAAPGDAKTLYGPGSLVQLESDGSGTIAFGADVVLVAGGSLAASGRVKTLPGLGGGAATYIKIGKSMSVATIAASAGAKVLVELCHPTPVYVPS